jgi:hypothetical protein
MSAVPELITCGFVGDGPTYLCLLCGQPGTDHPAVLRRALTDARDELLRYIDFMHKSDYREYAAPVEAKVEAINELLASAKQLRPRPMTRTTHEKGE